MKIISAIFISLSLALAAYSQQSIKTGAPAPEFSAASIDGKPLSLRQMQGKVVLLTFWSTRCQICHSEIPKLNRMAASYAGKDVVLLAVTMENGARVEPYLKKNPFNFTIVPDGFGMVLQYADKDRQGNLDMGFPAYYVIDKHGRVAMRGSGWDKTSMITSEIGRLLNSGE